jgi:hypothetical protein
MDTTLKREKTKKPGAAGKAAPVTRSRDRDNTQIPGYELIRRMKSRLMESGENSEARMIEALGLTRQYWNSFCNGHRPVETLIRNRDRLFWIADFLGTSALEVRMAAGDITPEELIAANGNPLWLEMEKIKKDPRWAMIAPVNEVEWNQLPPKIRILIVSLYQTVTQRDIKDAMGAKAKKQPTVETL